MGLISFLLTVHSLIPVVPLPFCTTYTPHHAAAIRCKIEAVDGISNANSYSSLVKTACEVSRLAKSDRSPTLKFGLDVEPSYTSIIKMGVDDDDIKESIVRVAIKSREAFEDQEHARALQAL
ncbi:hypothetical protein LguiA_024193 [Lonicera macranthoides]